MAAGGQRIKIVSDGTVRGTRVLLPNGEEMPGRITEVEWWTHAKRGLSVARLTFVRVEIEAEGQLQPKNEEHDA